MDVAHAWQRKHHSGEGEGMFLLSNRSGAFLSLGNLSKYNGLIWQQGSFFKTIESFSIIGQIVKIENNVSCVRREYADGATESFSFEGKYLNYSLSNYHGPLFLDLDMRRIDDESSIGRKYTTSQKDNTLRVQYHKFSDENMSNCDYTIELVVDGVNNFQSSDAWEPRSYSYDKKRADSCDFWIYRAGRINVEGTITLKIEVPNNAKAYTVMDGSLAQIMSFASLEALSVDSGDGCKILAGYPWFLQEWTRDELISLGAYIKAGQFLFVKSVLDKYYDLLESRKSFDAHFPYGGLRSADTLGWLAKRTLDLLHALGEKRSTIYSAAQLARIGTLMQSAIMQVPMRGGLVVNGPGETWMDAPTSGDTREGASIEIQALHLCALGLCSYLHIPQANHREKEFARVVKLKFFNGKLADNIAKQADFTARPNIFLAFYVYPHLLKLQEWRVVFDGLLEELWLTWGGLSSISKKSKLFIDTYQGMHNDSYHRGDSWYFVNCLAALCLHHFDGTHYKEYIAKIKDAAIDDLLFQGAFGHCSEVSSARRQDWGGCFAQSWSAAMLYELLCDLN